MKKKKLIFDFGSTYFSIFSEGRLLLRKPSAVILKKSLQPLAVSVGDEAVERKDALLSDEHFVRPVRKGAVAHREGCILLIKNYVTEAVGRFAFPHICVLVSCGLASEQRTEIEKAFVDAGYVDVMLMESLMGMMPACNDRKLKAALIIGGDMTEFGLFDDSKLLNAYSLDIGSDTVNQRIKNFMRDKYKLNVSDKDLEEIKIGASSLYSEDLTRISVSGRDAITGKVKKVSISAKELYSETVYVFGRIMKVVEAALTVAPIETVKEVAKTGLLVAGYGSGQEGFVNFASSYLRLPIIVAGIEERLPLDGAEKLILQPQFEDEYLGINKKNTLKISNISFLKNLRLKKK